MAHSVRYRIGPQATLELVMGDITAETTDAIVNAANSSLLGGGGVDGAIHDAAGPALLAECKKIGEQRGPLPPGQAVTTSGGKLKARYVIHTVGPVWQGGKVNEPQILESCYCHSIEQANSKFCTSVSFPSISTGACPSSASRFNGTLSPTACARASPASVGSRAARETRAPRACCYFL